MPDRGRYVVVVVMWEGSGEEWTGRATDPRGNARLVTYDPLRGLSVVPA